jgi:hypothetical protein
MPASLLTYAAALGIAAAIPDPSVTAGAGQFWSNGLKAVRARRVLESVEANQ